VTKFRDLSDVARETFHLRGATKIIVGGVYLMNAVTDDGVVHLARLTVRSVTDLSLLFTCRRLIIDGNANALSHLCGLDEDVSCMACIAWMAT
jgi:hypothetical protein